MKKNIYYVYVYLDVSKPGKFEYGEYTFDFEPFYVGKGSNGRDRFHLKGSNHNKEFSKRIKDIKESVGIKPMIVRIWEDLFEDDAYSIEWKMIKTIGTIYSKNYKGPLMNKAFTNVLDVTVFGNPSIKTYIMEHPYVPVQEICIGKYRFISFCENLKLDSKKLIKGISDCGWSLTIV